METRGFDRPIAELAGRQHGVVARWQLHAMGMPAHITDHRVHVGRLHVIHRGVYAVGHSLLSVQGRLMAGALAGGAGAVVSHISAAAEVWGITRTSREVIEVTGARHSRTRRGIRFHQGRLREDEVAVVRAIPVTTVPRTIFDLAAARDRRHLERMIHEAEVQRLWDPLSLGDLLDRYPRARGTAMLRLILGDRSFGSTVSRDDFVEAFLAFADHWGLPRPAVNRRLQIGKHWFEPDCLWEEQKLIVELDGGQVHATHGNFESDRARDRVLATTDWLVVRVTWRQLHQEAASVAADLHTILAARHRRAA
jgi:uncharacterized protein DUF559